MLKSPTLSFPILLTVPCLVAGMAALPAVAAEPKRIELGSGVSIMPALDLEAYYDDNIRAVGIGEESSWVSTVSPSVLLEAIDGLNLYQLKYKADYATFYSSHDDDHLNHSVQALGNLVFDHRNRLSLHADYLKTEQVANAFLPGVNDEFNNSSIGAVYGFGVPAATFNLDAGVKQSWRRTDNSHGINEDREFDTLALNGILYYRISAKTRALAEYRHEDVDYSLSGSTLDNERDIALLGLTWDVTAKTVGTVKVGQEKRDFDDSSRRDIDGSFWELDVSWQPRPLSTLSFSTRKGSQEGELSADYTKTTSYDLGWNQRWNQRMYSDVYYSVAEEDFSGQNRTDDINEMGVRLNYDLLRQVTVGVGYSYQDRDSAFPVRDYGRNIYMVNVNLNL